MCGRTACTLAPNDICRACGHQTKDGKWTQPRWKTPPGGQKYYTSYNIAPGSHTPVLLSKKHVNESELEPLEPSDMVSVECEWVVQPMQWGLVPSWHQGEPKEVMYKMNNARSDGILSKRSFKGPLEKGRRCVVVVDGYYEWHTGQDGKKQPYFIYFPAASSTKVEEVNQQIIGQNEVQQGVWSGRRVLTMAGLFDIWKGKASDEPLYSYSIITVDSHKSMSWIHHRMPAILNGEQEVRDWLDFGTVPIQKAMDLIRPLDCLQTHPVTTAMNSSSYKESDCVKPVDLEKEKESKKGSSKMMMAWLTKGKKPSQEGKADTMQRDKAEIKDEAKPDVKQEVESETKDDGDPPAAKKIKSEQK